jgi:outer membrane protein assembly factor BamE
MMNLLKPGMSKNQVAYVMGTPLIIDTFHPDRWDYIYSLHPGNGQREQRRITVYFKQDQLDHLDGHTRTVPRNELPEIVHMDSNVVVPLSNKKIGLIPKIRETIGMEEDEDEDVAEAKPDLFKNRPIPVPTKSTGIFSRITDSVSSDDIQDTPQEVEQALPSIIEQSEIDEPSVTAPIKEEAGFFDRIKNSMGLGSDESVTD